MKPTQTKKWLIILVALLVVSIFFNIVCVIKSVRETDDLGQEIVQINFPTTEFKLDTITMSNGSDLIEFEFNFGISEDFSNLVKESQVFNTDYTLGLSIDSNHESDFEKQVVNFEENSNHNLLFSIVPEKLTEEQLGLLDSDSEVIYLKVLVFDEEEQLIYVFESFTMNN